MKNISDIIEEFILGQLTQESEINLQRNELANFFNCAPSQINYVISTRFTPFRGYDVESRRGGGGYIKIYRLVNKNEDNYVQQLINQAVMSEIDYTSALHLLDNLKNKKIINDKEYNIIKSSISPKSLTNPIRMDDRLRANILKNILVTLIKNEEER